MKLLLALQFFNGDRDQAYRLARLIHKMQSGPSQTADFLFTWRFDAEHDPKMTALMQEKFKVHTHKSRMHHAGWPNGSNAIWCDLMLKLSERQGLGYKAVLTFEADCVPLTMDWIERLSAEWDKQQKYAVGHIHPCHGPGDVSQLHLNGNAMYSCNPMHLKEIARHGCPTGWGHDVLFAKYVQKLGWADTNVIRSFWRSKDFDNERLSALLDQGTAMLHGCKDSSLMDLVESQIAPP